MGLFRIFSEVSQPVFFLSLLLLPPPPSPFPLRAGRGGGGEQSGRGGMGRKILKDGSGSHRFAISFAHHSHSPTCLSSALPTGGAAGQKLLNQDRSGSSDILQHLSIPPPSRNYEENHKEEGGKKNTFSKKRKTNKNEEFPSTTSTSHATRRDPDRS